MDSSVLWLKTHKLTLFLCLIIAVLVYVSFGRKLQPMYNNSYQGYDSAVSMGAPMPDSFGMERSLKTGSSIVPPINQEAPPVDSPERLVIQDTSLSMVVKNVGNTLSEIEKVAQSHGGYLVQSYLSVPEGASSGTIVIRVQSDQRSSALDAIKHLGVRTTSEVVSGHDVTDEYVDIDARQQVLNTTKSKFEELLSRGEEIQDLLAVQRELINIQSQIDSLKGRQKYLEQSAALTKITVYLATDELALPYMPDNIWRPGAVFKYAVRSLITSLRSVVDALIWLGVYAVIWIPVLIIALLLHKFLRRK